jgi:hypothetical protein
MTMLKIVTVVAALLASGTSLAMAQNGPATGGEPPVAGGAGGNPLNGYYGYYATGGYLAAPEYAAPEYAAPGYAVPGYAAPGYAAPGYAAPGYAAPGYAAPGYARPVAQPGYVRAEEPSAAPGYHAVTHYRSVYMYAPPHGSSAHAQKKAPLNTEAR